MELALPVFPHTRDTLLVEQLAIRQAHQNTMGKSLVIPQAGEEANEKGNLQSSGEGANESLREFHINEGGIHA